MKNTLKKVMGAVMIVALLLGVLAVPPQNAQAALTLNTKNIIMQKGDSCYLKCDYDSDKCKWSSSNSKVAKVDSYGDITAKKTGKAVISVKAGKKTLKAKVTVVPKMTKKEITKIKVGKKQVNPVKKYSKYYYAIAFYTKNNKSFSGTLRGIKINSTLSQVAKQYGNRHPLSLEYNSKKCLETIGNDDKMLLKKMKISGITKRYRIAPEYNGVEYDIVLYFNKSNKVKAILVGKNYLRLQDALDNLEDNGNHIDLKLKGNVLYAK